ncbi:unnamed protein product [Merluccius merluccius]
MSSNSTVKCAQGDNLCVVRFHQKEVIVVPTLLLLATAVIMLTICLMHVCAKRRRSQTAASRPPTHRHHHHHASQRPPGRRPRPRPDRGRDLQGIDAPAEFNVMEHEVVPMTLQPVQRAAPPPPPPPLPPPPPAGWQHGDFSQLVALPRGFGVGPSSTTRYRAQLGRTPVVLRVLKDTAGSGEKEHFLGFAAFLARLGPHPFLPVLVGVVSVAPPLVMVVEELQHQDLLGFLWRCRQESSSTELPCDLTEKRIFTMSGQVASALEYLHGRNCIHGNVGAHSVLVGRDLTAKLWGLGPAYRRAGQLTSPWEQEDMEMRKWQAPEVLAGREVTQSCDVWSFGVLLFEMVTLGDAPFADFWASELLQQLQRGKTLRRPASCSNALYALIRSCCGWAPQQRPAAAQLLRKLRSGEKSANGQAVLRVPEPIDMEKYLREAGYGEAYNYAVF